MTARTLSLSPLLLLLLRAVLLLSLAVYLPLLLLLLLLLLIIIIFFFTSHICVQNINKCYKYNAHFVIGERRPHTTKTLTSRRLRDDDDDDANAQNCDVCCCVRVF